MSIEAEKQKRLQERLKEFDIEIRWEDSLDSTNNLSTELALQGQVNLVVADMQTAGRGRLGRSFVSGKGGLYESMAFCLNDIFPEERQPDLAETLHFPLLAALGTMYAVQEAFSKIAGVDIIPDIKWPNDLLVNEKKICGILCRAAQNREKWYIIIGIGINVWNELPADLPDAASLNSLFGDTIPDICGEEFMELLAAEVFLKVQDVVKRGIRDQQELLDEVEAHCFTIGKSVEVPERGVSGKALQIGDDGSLCVQTKDGSYEIVKSGDVIVYRE